MTEGKKAKIFHLCVIMAWDKNFCFGITNNTL